MANDWRDTVRAVLDLQADPGMDTAPGPALQWYPAQWLGDAAVQLMGWSARGVHQHLLMLAWKGFDLDSDPVPCSIPDDPDVLADLFQLGGDWPLVWRQVGRAWRRHEGRLWNLGLCRAYLAQMSKRRASRESAEKRWRRARTPRTEESQPGPNANALMCDANACGDDAKARSSVCSSVFSLPASLPPSEEEEHPSDVVGVPDGTADVPPTTRRPTMTAQSNGHVAEMRWRIEECWRSHCEAREIYWRHKEFSRPPGKPPILTAARRKLIGDAIRRHDGDLMRPEDRERFIAESNAWAAGRGIFLDPWLTAHDKDNKAGEGGKKYLEPERAWMVKSGIDQVDRHAAAYREHQARREAKKNAAT